MAEVPFEVTRDFMRSDLKEWRTEARDHRSALRRSRTLSLKSLEALQAQEPWAAVEDGPQALDDLIKDPTWLPPLSRTSRYRAPLSGARRGPQGVDPSGPESRGVVSTGGRAVGPPLT